MAGRRHENLGVVRLRLAGAGVVAALALAVLSACSTHAGAAAFVDGQRITQSDVNRYIVVGFTMPSATTGATQEPPRVFVLDSMVRSRVMERLFEKSLGGVPTDSQLAALHDQALATVFGIQASGADADTAVRQVLAQHGVQDSFLPVFNRDAELLMAVIEKINARQLSDIGNAVKKADISVTMSARYGAWSTENVSISGPATPDFLTLETSPAPAATPSP